MARVLTYDAGYTTHLPVYGASADILEGALLKRGPTPGTDNGMLIKATGASANPDIIGVLRELHDYSEDGDTLIAGTAFVTHPVELIAPGRLVRIEYDQTSVITCTEAVSTTTMTVTSLEDNIDACFVYVVSGTGAGQTNYATAAGSNTITLKAAFGTSLSTDSTFIKILPRFHPLGEFNTAGTKLGSGADAGAVTIMVIDTWIERNGRIDQMNPTRHAALTDLDSLSSVRFWADILIRDTIPYSID